MSPGDIVLVIYVFLLVPAMLVGFVFARRKWFEPYHKMTMTTITISNWILIGIVMVTTYREAVEPGLPQNLRFASGLIPTIHGLLGLSAQTLATYLVIRMWFEKQLPEWFKVKNIKRYMRTTLGLWLLTALFGVTVWAVLHRGFLTSPGENGGANPVATEPVGTPDSTQDATTVPASTKDATVAPAVTKDATVRPAATPAATAAVPAQTAQATPAATIAS